MGRWGKPGQPDGAGTGFVGEAREGPLCARVRLRRARGKAAGGLGSGRLGWCGGEAHGGSHGWAGGPGATQLARGAQVSGLQAVEPGLI